MRSQTGSSLSLGYTGQLTDPSTGFIDLRARELDPFVIIEQVEAAASGAAGGCSIVADIGLFLAGISGADLVFLGVVVAVVIFAVVVFIMCMVDAGCRGQFLDPAGTALSHGSAAAAGAWTGGAQAARNAAQNFPKLPRQAFCALGAAENMAVTATQNAVQGSHGTASDYTMAAAWGCATSGGRDGGGGSGNANLAKLRSFLSSLSDRQFDGFLESLEGAASRRGSATRSIYETRVILDEALSRGWTIEPHGVVYDWMGGRHIDLFNPLQLKRIHFPIPEGMAP